MNRNAVIVFGVLREADEHWLQPWEIARRAGLRSRTTNAALRDLRAAGIARRRDDHRCVRYGLASAQP